MAGKKKLCDIAEKGRCNGERIDPERGMI